MLLQQHNSFFLSFFLFAFSPTHLIVLQTRLPIIRPRSHRMRNTLQQAHANYWTHYSKWERSHIKGFARKPAYASCVNGALEIWPAVPWCWLSELEKVRGCIRIPKSFCSSPVTFNFDAKILSPRPLWRLHLWGSCWEMVFEAESCDRKHSYRLGAISNSVL